MKKVLTVGVFDYFHYGHLKLFEQAKQFGDYLIVAVQTDDCILKYKPSAQPLYTQEQRKEIISSLRIVDKVVLYSDVDEIVQYLSFDIFALGEDQTHKGFQRAEEYCRLHDIEVKRLRRTPNISSTEIKNNIR